MKTRREELDSLISNTLVNWELPKGKGKEVVKAELLSAIRTKKEKIILFDRRWHWVAAAGLVFVLLSYAVFYSGKVEHVTPFGQQQSIILPDGSSVQINADSRLNYNKYAWLISRNVNLSGEGFFKVTKGSQFKVNTINGTVKVLGTSFNVFSRESNLKVSCYQGKVSVTSDNTSTLITPGEEILVSDTEPTKKVPFQQKDQPEWTEGRFVYAKTPLNEVFAEIERQYNVTIQTSGISDEMQFTGQWDKNMSLNNVLEIVCLPFGLSARSTQEDQYTVSVKNL